MTPVNDDIIEQIRDTAQRMRRNILDMALQAGSTVRISGVACRSWTSPPPWLVRS